MSSRYDNLLIVLIGGALFLPFLGSVGLWDPWETHYAEVAREMIVRNDFVHPRWAGHDFFSKPVLPLWLIAMGLVLFGAEPQIPGAPLGELTAWGARLPMAILAVLTLWSVAKIARFVGGRNSGLLAAFALATCPTFVFIGKQAIVDMPLVAMTTAGIAYLLPALSGHPSTAPTHEARIRTLVFVVLAALPMFVLAWTTPRDPIASLTVIAAMVVVAAVAVMIFRTGEEATLDLVVSASFFGLAALAKGLAVVAVVGPLVLALLVFDRDLAMLKRIRPLLMIVVFLAVAAPWYVTMSLYTGRDDEGLGFVGRFWMHDNFARVTSGVHGDRGGAGYYVEQLLYGMFPWSALVPFALGAAAVRLGGERSPQRAALIVITAWAVWIYVLFTVSQTKFHHYVFPALPPIAVLLGLMASDVLDDPRRIRGPLLALGAAIFAVALRDMLQEPKTLVSLFTYKYDREFPREIVVRPFLAVIGGGGGALVLLAYLWRKPRWSVACFGATAALFALWIGHHHFNMLSPHWSQAHLFETYHRERHPGEPLIAYQLNWRGETFYSRNEAVEIMNQGASQRLLEVIARPGRAFVILEPQRFNELKNMLPASTRESLQIVDRSNVHFYLCMVED